ncbi:MAG: UDP-N-acetylmuramate dehydrogenase [Coriobacteriia bacterium]|nr:UDP-N-acetylmuramate dehydrogenase [Coriobacteriia bacterium]
MLLREATDRLRAALAGEVRSDEPMSRHTTFRIGGPASIYAVTDTLGELSSALHVLADEGTPWVVLGKGSNVLVSDEGYVGAVLVLGREFRRHTVTEDRMEAGAGCTLAALVQYAFSRGLAGLEFAVGIPGTLGGALVGNAGAREGCIGAIVESVTLFEPGEGLLRLSGADIAWGYRTSGLRGRGIIVEGGLRVTPGDRGRIRHSMETGFARRKASQPVGVPSAGSVFVNPEGHSAGRLIESAGMKGARVGGALVSPVHANFIVNDGGATAADVAALIVKVRQAVRDAHGIRLEPEIRFLGRFDGPA